MVALPYFVLVEALGPVIEAIGLVLFFAALVLGELSQGQLLFVASAYGIGLIVSIMVLILDDVAFGMASSNRTRLRMVWVAMVEHIVFRPLTIVWRLSGIRGFVQGRSDWGVQVRRGFSANTTPEAQLPRT